MSDTSPRLALPLLAAAQAQKHVTHNEALQRLDALVQLTVERIDAADPPPAPETGEIHALGPDPTGAWAGQAGQLAYRGDGAWLFLAPVAGWRAWDRAAGLLRVFDGTAWTGAGGSGGGAGATQNLDGVGIATTSDPVNRLAVASAAALFTHAGSDQRIVVNKAASGDTGSLVFQTGFSGRAEMGLTGADDWTIKVSPDGATWTDALRFDAATGLPGGAAVQTGATDATAGRLMATGAFGLGGLLPAVGDIGDTDGAIPTGFYFYNSGAGSTGAPAAALTGHLVHTRRASGGGEAQLLIVETGSGLFGTGTLLTRGRIAGAWSDWRRLYDTASVLGTVAQSGGLPTGALMEQGTSAAGSYRRLADGTQICTHTPTSLATGDLTWTYPAAFAAGSTPAVSVQPVSSDARIGVLSSVGPTAAAVAVRNLSNARQALPCHLVAIGRWF